MTDDKARDIKGETATELGEQRQNLTCLKAKAERLLKPIEAATQALHYANRPDRCSQPRLLPVSKDWPTWLALRDLTDDLAVTRTRIEELESRLNGWGAID